ncbi:hypothetical protein SARC_11145 [Sphaeroforma arctica JP610]|uniref:Carboxypeptidase n=1 Tax=Sphaeroforma arctica JP610 TaxID=667725 RepID=A0A0L0FHT9_9EUKA|nr:hypothetical protein SARC_11145 [Sphaeroforma arctica JP610]KNC76352.1 hypothetical protein SARC_11145 [Sphaeroforma arctica JP610]|eukprot:XP_014150254.1 hypothetical protein SARC_11145 [Sphaeroforma arctica JP610]
MLKITTILAAAVAVVGHAHASTLRFQSLVEMFEGIPEVVQAQPEATETPKTYVQLKPADSIIVTDPREHIVIIHPTDKKKSKVIPAGFCGDIESLAGFYPIGDNKEYFYWVFPSLNDPANDPIIFWLSGGPGCSSGVALFMEQGPCTITKDGKSTVNNDWAWNRNATVVFMDQPAGVGFSSGPETARSETEIGRQMHTFVEDFLGSNENLRDNRLFIMGESYGGHYVPAVGAAIHRHNILRLGKHINLAGIAVGNGLTNGVVQVPEYLNFYKHNPLNKPLTSDDELAHMEKMAPECTRQIIQCQQTHDTDICEKSSNFCNGLFMAPIQKAGLNQYDVRKMSVGPMAYDMSPLTTFLNNKDNQAILGVDKTWEPCNMEVHQHFMHEWMLSFTPNVTMLLDADIPVMLYAGDMDFSVNYLGVKAFARSVPWVGQEDFLAAEDKPWIANDELAGFVRRVGPLSFVQVHNAGHMVPMDQPENSLNLIHAFMFGETE